MLNRFELTAVFYQKQDRTNRLLCTGWAKKTLYSSSCLCVTYFTGTHNISVATIRHYAILYWRFIGAELATAFEIFDTNTC